MSGQEGYDQSQLKSIEKVALSVDRCQGNYAFLVGAGTSRAAGIKTAGELTDQWREEEYNRIDPDNNKDEWVNKKEESMKSYQNKYGFWFEEAYTTREERRRFVKELVEDIDPTFEHVVLSSLMLQEYVPITLTPNFDDLIYNAFYSYLEERPLLVDHNALAPQFKIVYGDPMIVKLHGDYLYDNLKNTGDETSELEDNIREVLEKVLGEYGLIVLGYSGRDESIMSVLNSDNVDIPDQGLYWCTTDKENLAPEVKKLLSKRNTYLVEIDSSMEFFYELYENLEGLSVPTPVDVRERANDRADQLEEGIVKVGGVEALGLAREYKRRGEFENATDLLTRAIETGVHDREVYELRAELNDKVGDYNRAVEDMNKVVEDIEEKINKTQDDEEKEKLNSKNRQIHNKFGILHARNGHYDDACDKFEVCLEMSEGDNMYKLNYAESKILGRNLETGMEIANSVLREEESPNRQANCLVLLALGKILEGEDYNKEKDRLSKLAEEGFLGSWGFAEVESFTKNKLSDSEMGDEIKDIITIYKEGAEKDKILTDGQIFEYDEHRIER